MWRRQSTGTWRDLKVPKLPAQMPWLWPLSSRANKQMALKWFDRGLMERRLRAWSAQWSGRLPHFSFSNPFRTGVEGHVKWFLFGRFNCLFSEPAEFNPPAVPQTWWWRLRMSFWSLWIISSHHLEYSLKYHPCITFAASAPETQTCHLFRTPVPRLM